MFAFVLGCSKHFPLDVSTAISRGMWRETVAYLTIPICMLQFDRNPGVARLSMCGFLYVYLFLCKNINM